MYRLLLAVALIPLSLPAQERAKWSGAVQVLPDSPDRTGFWQVGGRIVQITSSSAVDQDRGPIEMGSCVEVDAASNGENLVAATVQPQFGLPGCAAEPRRAGGIAEFRGILQDAASFGPTQRWRVNGRRVNVNPSTQLATPGFPQAGECVAIEGNIESEGTIAARRVEKLPSGGCAAPGADDPRIVGRVESLPTGGPLGEWRVYGQAVRVSPDTLLETRRGAFREGSCVEVRGRLDGPAFLADYVKAAAPDDCARLGAFEVRATLESRPSSLAGNWVAGGRTFAANAATILDIAKGSAIPGACVAVEARRDEAGGFVAVRIEVLSASGLCLERDGALNAASFESFALAPNQIVSVFGRNLGPASQAFFEVDAGNRISTRLAHTSVLFDGAPGAVLFASRGQANVVTPCSLSGKSSAVVQVESAGAWTQSARVPVLPAAPGVFTLSGSGRGPGAVLNYDPNSQRYTPNGPASAAPRGSVVAIYATGLGDTDRPCVETGVNPSSPPFARPLLPVRVLIGGREARIEFVGLAPGFVRGVFQINVTVPGDAPLGPNVPLAVEVDGTPSQDGVTMAVR